MQSAINGRFGSQLCKIKCRNSNICSLFCKGKSCDKSSFDCSDSKTCSFSGDANGRATSNVYCSGATTTCMTKCSYENGARQVRRLCPHKLQDWQIRLYSPDVQGGPTSDCKNQYCKLNDIKCDDQSCGRCYRDSNGKYPCKECQIGYTLAHKRRFQQLPKGVRRGPNRTKNEDPTRSARKFDSSRGRY